MLGIVDGAVWEDDSWPPFGFIGSDEDLEGIGKDLIDALNKRLDGVLVPHPGAWPDLYDAVAARELLRA